MAERDRFHETHLLPPGAFDGHLAEAHTADLVFPQFSEIDVGLLANLGSPHVLIDVDGTLTAQYSSRTDSISSETIEKIREIETDDRFETVSLATENGGHPEDMLHVLGMSATSAVFQTWEAGKLGTSWKTTDRFWRKILFEFDCFDEPEKVVIIGDSVVRDIATAQTLGLKTVLVGKHERRLRLPSLDQ